MTLTVLSSTGQGFYRMSLNFNFSSVVLMFRLGVMGFPGGSDGKESACNVGDPGLILGSEKSPGKGNGNPLQYSCLENSMDRRTWQATVHGVTQLKTTE